ncbi:MAG TPA: hypothetical protein VH763_07780 [Gemmatimonadales bacterium]|jgi:hypothetical protein
MYTALYTALGLGALLAVGTPLGSSPPAMAVRAPADTVALASKLTGKWSGTRFDSSSTAGTKFTMDWKKGSDGKLVGTVAMANGPSYQTQVVWNSDTAFITESAPHKSAETGQQVVTRMINHFKGDSLTGTFEVRPMTYKGRSLHGHFTAARG